jgi:twinkle protein
VPPGELTLVTGVPNSGKSEWLDALAVNLAAQQVRATTPHPKRPPQTLARRPPYPAV